jgi:hypothetical protein
MIDDMVVIDSLPTEERARRSMALGGCRSGFRLTISW